MYWATASLLVHMSFWIQVISKDARGLTIREVVKQLTSKETPSSPEMLIFHDNEGSSSSALGEIRSSGNASRASTPTAPEDTRKKGKGKGGSVKRTPEERMKDAIESVFISVMIEMQKSDEALLTELEEKRMKFEENRLKEERDYQ